MCKDRNETVKKTLLVALRSIFDRNVQGSAFNKCSLARCMTHRRLHLVLKCYLTLNMVSDIEAYYRENFVAPFLDSMITRVLSHHHPDGLGEGGRCHAQQL